MHRYIYKIVCALIIAFLPEILSGQDFICSVYDDAIEAGTPFQVVYTSHSGEIDNIQLPSVSGLDFSGRSGFSSSMSIINGKKKSVFEYTYQAVITKEGRFTIPPAKGRVNGKTVMSNTLSVNVTKPNQKPVTKGDGDVFFKAKLSREKIYSGQQVILSYDIYTSKNVMNAEFVKKPQFQHIFLKPIDVKRQGKTVNISGKQFYTQTIDSYILFAQKTGKHMLEKADIIYKYEKANAANPFFNEVESQKLSTNALVLEVLDLPDQGKPKNFSGGVGNFTFSAQIDKKTVTTDEVIKVKVAIKGDGDPKFWGPPAWDTIPGFEAFEPNLLDEQSVFENGREYTIRSYEYLFRPENEMKITLQPSFSYFSPEDEKYVTLTGESHDINVLPGNTPATDLENNEALSLDSEFTSNEGSLSRSNIFMLFGSILIVLLVAIVLFFLFRKRKSKAQPNKVEAQQEMIPSVNKESVQSLLNEGKKKEFYKAIMTETESFIKQKYGASNGKMTTDQLVSLLQKNNVDEETINRFKHIYTSCEYALFAGIETNPELIYEEFKKLISVLEKNN